MVVVHCTIDDEIDIISDMIRENQYEKVGAYLLEEGSEWCV